MAGKNSTIFCLLVLCSTPFAQGGQDSNSTFLLGPGLVITDKPYTGVDTSVYPIPLMKFVSGRFYISGATAGYRLLASQEDAPEANQTGWSLDFIGKYRFDGFDADDSDRLEGMNDRKQTVDVGGEFAVTGNWGEAWMSVVTDSLGEHDGQEIKVGYMKHFIFDKLTLSPGGGLIWQSNNLANYYYGVRSGEARAGRPAYHVGDSTNSFVGLRAEYKADERWTLIAGVQYQFLDSKIRKSPIVDDSFVISVLAGAMYKF
jgi:outer membrane protein